MQFDYFAKNTNGEEKKGVIDATSKHDVAKLLREQGYTVISCEESSSETAPKNSFFSLSLESFKRITIEDKIDFSRNLSAMISAGLSLTKSLEILKKQTTKEKFKNVINNLILGIKQGNPLNESMKKNPQVFSSLFISMTKVGEETGGLSSSLKIMSEQLEKENSLRKKIKGAMIYPAVIICAMILIGILMLIYVVPTLVATFKDMKMELPWMTKMIIAVSDFMVNNIILFLISLIAGISAIILFFKSKIGKIFVDNVSLHIPIISPLIKKINSARTARTLSSLVSAGVDVLESLSITQEVVQNHKYKDILNKTKEDIQKGLPVSESFKNASDLYPIQVGEMIAVGEETGQLSNMLERLATFYEDEVNESTENMSKIIEPFLMIIIGVAVGFFAISMIKPMYSMMEGI